ncbi:MAG: site-2 protease family protein [Gemmatimonadota bacterium]
MAGFEGAAARSVAACPECHTELAPNALACPACGWLVHSEALKQIAARAEEQDQRGALSDAHQSWETALELLPATSRQHAVITQRLLEIEKRQSAQPADSSIAPTVPAHGSVWQKSIAVIAGLGLLLLGKFKFLLLGLTKLKTFASMFAFFGVYWSMYGWMLALGLVLSIYIHEMGHVAMLRRLNIAAGAPLFIPGVGAFVMLKQRVLDPKTDAAIGLAGPVWGLGAGIAALVGYWMTDARIWLAIAQLTGFINLFNLIPIWQLDGSRAFHALSRMQRWSIVAALVAAVFVTGQKLLIIVAAVAVWRAFQKDEGPGDQRALLTFVALIFALGWLSAVNALGTAP